MKKISGQAIIAFLIILLMGSISACAGPVKNQRQLESATINMGKLIQSKLSNLDNAVSGAAEKIAEKGLQGDETRSILNGLCDKYPYLIDCVTSDADGKIITAAPEEYRRLEGTDTSTTEASIKFQEAFKQNKKPLLTTMFRSVEGIDAVVLVWPVISEEGELAGAVNALFKPETLLGKSITYAAEVRAMEVEVMQTDGLAVYHSKGNDAGKNLLTDPAYKDYPDLVSLGTQIISRQTGSGSYHFPSHVSGQMVKKTVFWTSVGLHETWWRIVSIAELGG